jgi:hypothetical protein
MVGRPRIALVTIALAASIAAAASAAAGIGDRPADVAEPAVRLERPPASISIVAVGDVLPEARVRLSASRYGALIGARFDFAPLFAPVEPIISSADLAICHMELPVGRDGGPYGNFGRSDFGGNRILAPYEVAIGVRAAGFDACSTASNHSLDLGADGIASTIEALTANGIASTGTAISPEQARPRLLEVDGVRVGLVSYTVASNMFPSPEAWRLNFATNSGTISLPVEQARRDGAQIVLLSLHLAQELLTAPRPDDRAVVEAIVASTSVDAVFMHGPHVVQPFEYIDGTPVWWSLGNFISEMGPPSTGRYADPRTSDGLVAFLRFTERPDGTFEHEAGTIAICNDRIDRTVRAPVTDLARDDLPLSIRNDLAACAARTRSLVPDAN